MSLNGVGSGKLKKPKQSKLKLRTLKIGCLDHQGVNEFKIHDFLVNYLPSRILLTQKTFMYIVHPQFVMKKWTCSVYARLLQIYYNRIIIKLKAVRFELLIFLQLI